eukprot:COSAG06_NODE_7350_length_2534_cov_19.102669_3_plen_88_part_00
MEDFFTPPHFKSLFTDDDEEEHDGETAAGGAGGGTNDTKGAPPQQQQQDPLFFLGARGSGVGFHRHGEAWNAVIFGKQNRTNLKPKV